MPTKLRHSRGPQKCLQLRKREFDRIEIMTVGRRKPEARADAFDRSLRLRLLVHGEVIEDDDVPGPKRRDEHLLDVGEERRIVVGPSKTAGACRPSTRNAATTVCVCQWLYGA